MASSGTTNTTNSTIPNGTAPPMGEEREQRQEQRQEQRVIPGGYPCFYCSTGTALAGKLHCKACKHFIFDAHTREHRMLRVGMLLGARQAGKRGPDTRTAAQEALEYDATWPLEEDRRREPLPEEEAAEFAASLVRSGVEKQPGVIGVDAGFAPTATGGLSEQRVVRVFVEEDMLDAVIRQVPQRSGEFLVLVYPVDRVSRFPGYPVWRKDHKF